MLQKVNRLDTAGGENNSHAVLFLPPFLPQESPSTHFQRRLSQFLCFRLEAFANSRLFGENGCNCMSQSSSCSNCALAFRSDPCPDLVHRTEKPSELKNKPWTPGMVRDRAWGTGHSTSKEPSSRGSQPCGAELPSGPAPREILRL